MYIIRTCFDVTVRESAIVSVPLLYYNSYL